MKIRGTFKDANDDIITVVIYNVMLNNADINIDNCDWIRFTGDEPVIIETDCEDSFTHIIKKRATINLLTRRWMGDYLFAYDATSIVVNIFRTRNNVKKCLFAGYVEPCAYNQDYANAWEKITITCMDNLTALEYKKQNDVNSWSSLISSAQMRTFKELIQRMGLDDTRYIIDNLPDNTQYSEQNADIWIETSFERNVEPDGTIHYYVVESLSKQLDADTAVTTGQTQLGNELTPTYIDSEETTLYNGELYYKAYAWVLINGEWVNTGDWIIGSSAQEDFAPTIVDHINVLDGWSYGAHQIPFEYYEHFRIDNVMSDGAIKRGANDTIGDRIPETPQQTTNGSYYEFRQGDADDLYEDERGIQYYKNYAWIIMNFDFRSWTFKTGDWVQGSPYIQEAENGGELTPNNP